jgi:toxin YoeB
VKWKLVFTEQALKDAQKLKQAGLKDKTVKILDIIQHDPFQSPPPFEKLVGDLIGAFSRRINIQHRIIYQVYFKEHIMKIIRMWTNYNS